MNITKVSGLGKFVGQRPDVVDNILVSHRSRICAGRGCRVTFNALKEFARRKGDENGINYTGWVEVREPSNGEPTVYYFLGQRTVEVAA